MAEIRQGITPTFTLLVPETVDLTQAENVYVTFRQGSRELTKTGREITVSAHSIDVFLSQEETLSFERGSVRIQVNWVYADGNRGETNIASVEWAETLLREVLE